MYAVAVLKNLVPAIRDGTRIVLFEWLMKEEPPMRATEKMSV